MSQQSQLYIPFLFKNIKLVGVTYTVTQRPRLQLPRSYQRFHVCISIARHRY